jgi:hypothetical protein
MGFIDRHFFEQQDVLVVRRAILWRPPSSGYSAPLVGEFEVLIMIAIVIEEMDGAD